MEFLIVKAQSHYRPARKPLTTAELLFRTSSVHPYADTLMQDLIFVVIFRCILQIFVIFVTDRRHHSGYTRRRRNESQMI